MATMRLARWVFAIAGVYGLLILTPMLGMESQIGREHPPAITHPEYYYGFLSIGLAWQIAFLVIATDPVRFRLLIIPAILEKASFAIAAIALLLARGVPTPILAGAMIDLLLGLGFVASWFATKPSTLKPAN